MTQEDFSGDRKYDKKTYSYDAYGHRISVTNDAVDPTGDKSYTYAYDVHGSVSMLLDQSSSATVSYGYDAYGDKDAGLSAGDSDDQDPLNAFRYTAKRFDSGSGTLDMGARRFGPDTTRFLQQDQYMGALSDLGLSLDPLTQNRYSLAGGNPVSFVETDGHMVVADGGGGGSTDPNPTDGWAAGGSAGTSGSSTTTASTSSEPTPAPSPGPYPDCSVSQCSDDGVDLAGAASGVCEFLGPCAIADAVEEGNWLRAGLEVAMMLPIGKIGKLGKLAKIGDRADDAGDVARVTGRSDNLVADLPHGVTFRSFTRSNFRENLGRLTGSIPANAEAHHVLPVKFESRFREAGLNIHDPRFGAWWTRTPHRQSASQYNTEWQRFLSGPRGADDTLTFGREMGERYGFQTNF